ncbi:hypothetical protein [Comamonas testosteroni]|jgi:hypothetical protein|uniref:hypothetical protein n=1 Tax=Comamonas testosteroni TaxID=285 RepID=UPI0026ED77DB|nr:hypothetical protein [Comamonas testosteroni]
MSKMTDEVVKASAAMDVYCALQHALIAAIEAGVVEHNAAAEQIIDLCNQEMGRNLSIYDDETRKLIMAAMKNPKLD